MSQRVVRMVPVGWQHPRDGAGRYKPLYEGREYAQHAKEWEDEYREHGLQGALDCCGDPPNQADYMPEWDEAERTHFMMYEECSEGTPISPALATGEELARYLAETGASVFGAMTATYEHWLRIVHGGWNGLVFGDGSLHPESVEKSDESNAHS